MADEFTPFAPSNNYRPLGDWGGVIDYGGPKNNVALFYNKAVPAPGKSAASGRPIFEEKVYVRIGPPGERLNIVDRPATDKDRRDYPVQWAQFQQNREQIPEGTPVDMLYPEHPAVGLTLRAHGVHTIEQCAELTAHAIENIGMGAQRYVNDAQKYVKMSERGVKATEFRREIEERDGQIRTLTHQLDQLSAEVSRLTQNAVASPNMAQMQQFLATTMQRPVHMPQASYDASAAQIHANHPTTQAAQAAKARRRVKAS